MLLAIDTATHVAGLALYDQSGPRAEQVWYTANNHSVELMPLIVRMCEQTGLTPAGLSAVAVSLGPGSFTGLRVGLSVAKGLAVALSIPVFGVPTLDATAYAHRRESAPVCAIVPAGRGRWCAALYRATEGRWQRQSEYLLSTPERLAALLQEPTLVCGEIDAPLSEFLRRVAGPHVILASPASALRRPGYLAELAWQRLSVGERDDLVTLAPIYVQPA